MAWGLFYGEQNGSNWALENVEIGQHEIQGVPPRGLLHQLQEAIGPGGRERENKQKYIHTHLLHPADTFPQVEIFALLFFKISGAACLASLGLFVLISAFYLLGFLCSSTGKSCHGTFNTKRKQAQKFPFTHRITAHFQRPDSVSSPKFYDGIVISTIPPNRYSVSIQKTQF